jgi:1,4-dihydroxy-2-naphthoate octaprenyltransferase
MSPTTAARFWLGVWRIVDPKITLASVASIALGTGAAARGGAIDWTWWLITFLGVFCIEGAKNASGEVVDFASGTDQAVAPEDRSPFSGGKRVLVDGLLTRGQTIGLAVVLYGLGVAYGMLIVALREPRVLGLGIAGIGLAFFYHAPPFKLSYRGLGELAVALAYGPLIAGGTYLVQRHHLDVAILTPSIPLALLIAAFLWINEFPDFRADSRAGKRNLVVRLGRPRAARVFAGIVIAAYVLLLLLPCFPGGPPLSAWLGLFGLPHGLAAARRLLNAPENTAAIVPAQGWTLLSFLLMAAGAAVGLVLD